jgi:uncharacterized protein (DUF305 family)
MHALVTAEPKENQMKRRWLAATTAALAIAVAVGVTACGGGDDSGASGNATDRAFVAGMIPHHEQAIEMAKMAQYEAQSQFVRGLADDIVAAQSEEIGLMKRIDGELADDGVEVGDLGMSGQMMGMESQMSALESAHPFDREFVDMMIAHHQGAIRMAQVEIEEGQNDQLVALANRIDAAQSNEIHEMNRYRQKAFGSTSPSGGVPSESSGQMESGHSMEDMG